MTAQDESTNVQAREPVIPTNGARLYSLSLFGLNRFRVSASTRTSGTLSVVIAPGAILIEPVVASVLSNPAGAQLVSYTAENAAYATSVALRSLVPQRNLTASAAATTHTVPAGKTFRILNFNASIRQGATTAAIAVSFNLRAVLTGP